MATYEEIKSEDFKAQFEILYNDIENLKYTPKCEILSLLRGFKADILRKAYEPREEIEVYKFMEVR